MDALLGVAVDIVHEEEVVVVAEPVEVTLEGRYHTFFELQYDRFRSHLARGREYCLAR